MRTYRLTNEPGGLGLSCTAIPVEQFGHSAPPSQIRAYSGQSIHSTARRHAQRATWSPAPALAPLPPSPNARRLQAR